MSAFTLHSLEVEEETAAAADGVARWSRINFRASALTRCLIDWGGRDSLYVRHVYERKRESMRDYIPIFHANRSNALAREPVQAHTHTRISRVIRVQHIHVSVSHSLLRLLIVQHSRRRARRRVWRWKEMHLQHLRIHWFCVRLWWKVCTYRAN